MQRDWTVPGYRHIRELGAGASGRVVMAVHEETSIEVAIKYLAPELAMDPDFVLRFRDEAQLLSELEDPHLVQFFEYVETSTSAAIVMELIDGVSLAHILAEGGPTTPEAALTVLKGSLLGLATAHASGIVHRDYKPGNVLVDGQGQSFLSDFGIAVRVGADITAAGTPAYMPPEQWDGGPVGPASDVYAATAVAYECLTGRRPYRAATLPALAAAHRAEPVPVEEVPESLRALIAAGLAKDVRERPQSAFAFLLELEMTAGAAYGAEWEERGHAHLKTRALALALLFPVSRPADFAARADTAVTMLDAPAPAGEPPAPYRPSKRLGLAAVTAGALASLAVLSGGVFLVNNVAGGEPLQPQAAPGSVQPVGPGQAGGGPAPSPSAAPEGGPKPGPVVVVTADTDPVTDPESPSSTGTPTDPTDPAEPTPSETDSPDPEPTDPTDDPDDPTESPDPTDPAEPTEPADPDEPAEPTDPVDPDEPTGTPDAPAEPDEPAPTTQSVEPAPVEVSGLRVSARVNGYTMIVTIGVTGVTGTAGSTTVNLRMAVDGKIQTVQIGGVKGPTTRVYTRSLTECGGGVATASADGITVSSTTVKAPCVR